MIVLGIDPALGPSGWALVNGPDIIALGSAKKAEDIMQACGKALAYESECRSSDRSARLMAVGESWATGRKARNRHTEAGLGAGWGRWLMALQLQGHPASRTKRAPLDEWRKGLFGKSNEPGDVAKRRAIAWAWARWNVRVADDVAEALCITAWFQKRGL